MDSRAGVPFYAAPRRGQWGVLSYVDNVNRVTVSYTTPNRDHPTGAYAHLGPRSLILGWMSHGQAMRFELHDLYEEISWGVPCPAVVYPIEGGAAVITCMVYKAIPGRRWAQLCRSGPGWMAIEGAAPPCLSGHQDHDPRLLTRPGLGCWGVDMSVPEDPFHPDEDGFNLFRME